MLPDHSILFAEFDLAGLELSNRFVLPPMTRCRVPASGVPDGLTVAYYTQRATAGLLIGEGTCPVPGGQCVPGVPGIYLPEQVAGWRRVANGVHAAGGRLFLQLWHAGRVSSAAWQPDGAPPLGASAIRAAGAMVLSPDGQMSEPDTPREASVGELARLVDGFAQAARNAIAAGCDGVEIHGANGYLLHQFFSERANRRSDAYGGSVARRVRFAVEVAEAVAAAVGAHRTGLRISPLSTHQAAVVDDPSVVYPELLRALDPLRLAYVHCVEGEPGGATVSDAGDVSAFDFLAARKLFAGAWIANNFYDADRAARAIRSGHADLVSFGRPFVANPDLVDRVRRGAELNQIDPATLYSGGAAGYTDYPSLERLTP